MLSFIEKLFEYIFSKKRMIFNERKAKIKDAIPGNE